MLPKDNPLSKFNEYFYLDSGTGKMPIYIFKFGNKGILFELHLNDKESGPRGKVFTVTFENDYDFKLNDAYKSFVRRTIPELYFEAYRLLELEAAKFNGTES